MPLLSIQVRPEFLESPRVSDKPDKATGSGSSNFLVFRVYAKRLVKKAYDNWNDIIQFEDEASSRFMS